MAIFRPTGLLDFRTNRKYSKFFAMFIICLLKNKLIFNFKVKINFFCEYSRLILNGKTTEKKIIFPSKWTVKAFCYCQLEPTSHRSHRGIFFVRCGCCPGGLRRTVAVFRGAAGSRPPGRGGRGPHVTPTTTCRNWSFSEGNLSLTASSSNPDHSLQPVGVLRLFTYKYYKVHNSKKWFVTQCSRPW